MNKRIREFEKESGLEIYGLGTRRIKWEATIEKFTDLVVQDILDIMSNPVNYNKYVYTTYDADRANGVAQELSNKIKEHFKDTQ